MPTISTADFKNGLGLRIKDKVYTIVEFQHVKPGKGGAFVRYKTRDIKSGRVVENTCNAGTKFESVMLTTRTPSGCARMTPASCSSPTTSSWA